MKQLLIAFLLISGIASAQVKTMPDFKFVRMDNGAEYSPKNLTPGKKNLLHLL